MMVNTSAASMLPPVGMARPHILVVDDEPEIAESLSDYLDRQGYTVSIVPSGQGALNFLEEAVREPNPYPVDLVLLDMRMPDMPGQQVLEQLRAHPHQELRYTRVIMLTAAAGNRDKIEALSAGADDYITKPYHPQELLARVQTLLRTQQLEKQLQRQREQLADLNAVGQDLATTLEVRSVYGRATTAVQKLLDVEAAGVFAKSRAQRRMVCQQISGGGLHTDDYPAVPLKEGILGQTAARPSIFCVNDVSAEPLFQAESDQPPGLTLHAILSVPIIVRDRIWGVLAAFNPRAGEFADFDIDLLASLSTSLGRAIENAWLVQNLQVRQQDLLDNRNALQAIIDGILHPIYTINDDWRLVAVNENKARELDMTPNDLIDRPCYQAFFGRDEPCAHCRVNRTMENRTPQTWSVRWTGDDRLPREWDVNAYPVPGGRQAGAASAVVVWQDRTEERRLEQSLLQAGKLAAIGQLAAGVAHEINNPLTAVNANAEMLKLFIPEDDDQYEAVDLIHRAGLRATKVVRGLLDFAREQQYTFVPIDINKSISQALDLVAYQLHTAHVEVLLNLSPDLPKVGASSEHIKSVWINLMMNARDAMRDAAVEAPQLELNSRLLSAVGDEEAQVEIVIRDNGPGIPDAEAAHIFEPFYTTKDPGQGTGLGLATCHRIIQQHGGRVEVVSQPGQGAAFVVRLPVSSK